MSDSGKVIKGLGLCSAYAVLNVCHLCPYNNEESTDYSGCIRELTSDALALLSKQQEKIAEYQMIYGGDAVITGELIRCRDCKHYRDGYCILNDIGTTKNWFCADGKRRVEDGTVIEGQ